MDAKLAEGAEGAGEAAELEKEQRLAYGPLAYRALRNPRWFRTVVGCLGFLRVYLNLYRDFRACRAS